MITVYIGRLHHTQRPQTSFCSVANSVVVGGNLLHDTHIVYQRSCFGIDMNFFCRFSVIASSLFHCNLLMLAHEKSSKNNVLCTLSDEFLCKV